jgi:transcriptional regulator with XRE-family HTH domain
MTLLRTHIGNALRAARVDQGRTLRDVAKSARVSLGYLSEVERGQKEASSELLNSICTALELQLSKILIDVTAQVAAIETPALKVVEEAA